MSKAAKGKAAKGGVSREAFAGILTGWERGVELTRGVRRLAATNGLIAAYVDACVVATRANAYARFIGGMEYEAPCRAGDTFSLAKRGAMRGRRGGAEITIERDAETGVWRVLTPAPHASFETCCEGGGRFCEGIVISAEDLPDAFDGEAGALGEGAGAGDAGAGDAGAGDAGADCEGADCEGAGVKKAARDAADAGCTDADVKKAARDAARAVRCAGCTGVNCASAGANAGANAGCANAGANAGCANADCANEDCAGCEGAGEDCAGCTGEGEGAGCTGEGEGAGAGEDCADVDWDDARRRLDDIIEAYKRIPTGTFALLGVLYPLRARLEGGERTREIYEAIQRAE